MKMEAILPFELSVHMRATLRYVKEDANVLLSVNCFIKTLFCNFEDSRIHYVEEFRLMGSVFISTIPTISL
jgi:hypothetical protein